jgi:predicted TIM-barrel fold metal-dependent hydrolase
MRSAIRELCDSLWIHDTHEHLEEEATRLARAWDWTILISHYANHDLIAAGMSAEQVSALLAPGKEPAAKWRMLAPFWPAVRQTGYFRAVRITARDLFGVDEWSEAGAEKLEAAMQAAAKPGFYRTVLRDHSRIVSAQVNALEAPVFRSESDPPLLTQDISVLGLAQCARLEAVREETGLAVDSLTGYLGAVDWYFAKYGDDAVAIKNQCAYGRRLDFADVPISEATPIFARRLKGDQVYSAEAKVVEDCVMRHCIEAAAARGLPVKLHTGYYAGNNGMPLDRVGRNPADLCPVLQRHPRATFVLMHIGYPYQDQMIALAKHYSNAVIDLCWAWIINPAASVRFVKEFLMAAPASKLLAFGGDYIPVEPVYGHSRIARQGVAQALSELVDEGWMSEDEALDAARMVLHDNAQALFPRLQQLAAHAPVADKASAAAGA